MVADNGQGSPKYGNRCLSSPEQMLIEKLLLKITTKSYITNVKPRTDAQQNYKCRRLQGQARILPNLLLYAAYLSRNSRILFISEILLLVNGWSVCQTS